MAKTAKRITADRAFENYYLDTDSSLSHYPKRQASKKEEQKQEELQSASGTIRRQNRNRRFSRENLSAMMLVLGWAGAIAVVVFFIVLAAIREVRM